ncbi:MAG: ABC transporter substrate-binding protein [Nitrososphaerota archaeon]|nr:ABC transporter substrate-binding protein [Nitrososphaerota archaeon]MDG6938924.1 ABC transporter substrate-binding protein [Nitrososphaerota archaeon]
MTGPNTRRAIATKTIALIIVAVVVVGGLGVVASQYLSPKPKPTSLIIGVVFNPVPPQAINIEAAKDLGIFAQNGLNVTVENVPGGGAVLLQSMIAGKTTAVEPGFAFDMGAILNNASIVNVMVPEPVQPGMVVATSAFTSVSQLANATLGISSQSAGDQIALEGTLSHYNVSLSGVHWVTAGSPASRLKALVAGKIDAAFITADQLPVVKEYPQLNILVPDVSQFMPWFPTTFLTFTRAFVQQNPTVVAAAVKSIIQASRIMNSNESAFAYVVQKELPGYYNSSQVSDIWTYLQADGNWGVNGGINYVKLNHSLDFYKTVINPSAQNSPLIAAAPNIMDTTFVNQALNQLGVINTPQDVPDWRS